MSSGKWIRIKLYAWFMRSCKIMSLCDVVSRLDSVGVAEDPASPVLSHPVMQCYYHAKLNKYMSVYVE
jgi:hypothetical protein